MPLGRTSPRLRPELADTVGLGSQSIALAGEILRFLRRLCETATACPARWMRPAAKGGPFHLQDFLTLWKDADPDIPILKEAKAEYAKLQ